MGGPGSDNAARKTCVIFLDVDGVLNSKKSRKMRFREDTGGLAMDDSPVTDLLENLKHVVEGTQCDLIISSTWRCEEPNMVRLGDALSKHGLRIAGATPICS